MTLQDLVRECEWVHGNLIDDDIERQAVAAARQFLGWGEIAALVSPDDDPDAPALELTVETELTNSEWAVIKPLFLLYVERENARALEASRTQGVEMYGRTVSEVEADITRYEEGDLPRFAFHQNPETI
jgi:hypothetical protein